MGGGGNWDLHACYKQKKRRSTWAGDTGGRLSRLTDNYSSRCREASFNFNLLCSSSSSSSASIHQHVSDCILEQGTNVHAHDGLHLPVQSRRLFLTNVGEKKHGQLFHLTQNPVNHSRWRSMWNQEDAVKESMVINSLDAVRAVNEVHNGRTWRDKEMLPGASRLPSPLHHLFLHGRDGVAKTVATVVAADPWFDTSVAPLGPSLLSHLPVMPCFGLCFNLPLCRATESSGRELVPARIQRPPLSVNNHHHDACVN